jgi:hypothetical protein
MVPLLADCDTTSGMIGDPDKLSRFALDAVRVNNWFLAVWGG